ncbi:MAG: methyltransferase domain-containing protein [Patescibacteria group bacterium]
MERDWPKYFELTKDKPPRPLLVKALSFVKEKGNALDIGAGALNDSLHLLAEGFTHVTALDKEPIAQEIAQGLPADTFAYVISSAEDFDFPRNTFNLVNAQYALPFISKESFNGVWSKIKDSLKEEGIFTGQLFGERDEWANNGDMTFHTEAEVRRLLSDFEVLDFEEKEKDQPTASGVMKHWHVFHFIVRK